MLSRANSFMWRRISAMAVLAFGAGLLLLLSLALTNLPSEASGDSSSPPLQGKALHSPYFSPTPTPTCGPAWRIASADTQSPYTSVLYAVAAASVNDVWAVGKVFGSPSRTLI